MAIKDTLLCELQSKLNELNNKTDDYIEKLQEIAKEVETIQNELSIIKDIKSDFKVGDRVQLKYSLASDKFKNDVSKLPKHTLKYFHPGNPATIVSARVICSQFCYILKFDEMPEDYKDNYVAILHNLVRPLKRELSVINCIEDIREFFTGKRY